MPHGDGLAQVFHLFPRNIYNFISKEKEIPLYGIGENPTQKNWTNSNKAYGIFNIDDINVGCPLKFEDGKYLVDWDKIVEILEPKLKELNEL